MKNVKTTLLLALLLNGLITHSYAQKSLRLGVAGLNHNHVYGILSRYRDGKANIVGIAEPNKALWVKFGKIFHIPDSLFFTDLKTMVLKKKPDAVLGYNAAANHVDIVEVKKFSCILVRLQLVLRQRPAHARRVNVPRFDIVNRHRQQPGCTVFRAERLAQIRRKCRNSALAGQMIPDYRNSAWQRRFGLHRHGCCGLAVSHGACRLRAQGSATGHDFEWCHLSPVALNISGSN